MYGEHGGTYGRFRRDHPVPASGSRPQEGEGAAEGPAGPAGGQARDRGVARRSPARAGIRDRISPSDPGPVAPDLGGAPGRAGRRAADGVCRGVRDRDVLRAFRRGQGGRAGPAAAHHPRLRQRDLRDVRVQGVAGRAAADRSRRTFPRAARAVRRLVPSGAGGRGRAPFPAQGRCRSGQAGGRGGRYAPAYAGHHRLRPVSRLGRLPVAGQVALGRRFGRRDHDGAGWRRAARAGRRRVPHRAQMAVGAGRAKPAADGGQW